MAAEDFQIRTPAIHKPAHERQLFDWIRQLAKHLRQLGGRAFKHGFDSGLPTVHIVTIGAVFPTRLKQSYAHPQWPPSSHEWRIPEPRHEVDSASLQRWANWTNGPVPWPP